jgi:hypothetical protein
MLSGDLDEHGCDTPDVATVYARRAENNARMGPRFIDRLPSELDEMAHVARDQTTPFVGRGGELFSVRAIETADIVSARRVDPPRAQGGGDARAEILVEVDLTDAARS